jgi:hypothetical protein
MWRSTSRFFLGIFAAAIFTNAAVVYLLHDVDPDRIGELNLAYGELTLEFFSFGIVLAVFFSCAEPRLLRCHHSHGQSQAADC